MCMLETSLKHVLHQVLFIHIIPTFYPVIYGAEETDDWTDPKVWKKANPSLGITVSIDKVQACLLYTSALRLSCLCLLIRWSRLKYH